MSERAITAYREKDLECKRVCVSNPLFHSIALSLFNFRIADWRLS